MEDKIKLIAQRVKDLREVVEVSVDDMAKELNISKELYLEYEKGKHDFTFSILYSIANKLGVDIVDLMTGETPHLKVCSVVRKGEGLHMERRKEYKYEHLAYIFKNKIMEPFLVTVELSDVDARTHQNTHDGQEFNYVLEGSMKLLIKDSEIILNKGDAAYYDAKTPHSMEAIGGRCRFLSVIAK
ncbi:MAG: cupin domain-containing protein [Eubacteriales bacterium]